MSSAEGRETKGWRQDCKASQHLFTTFIVLSVLVFLRTSHARLQYTQNTSPCSVCARSKVKGSEATSTGNAGKFVGSASQLC